MQGNILSETTFELPGGLVLGDERRLSYAELRPLAGREEEWLASHPGTPGAKAVTRLLSACLVHLDGEPPAYEYVQRLLVGDRDYLMLQLRCMTLGDHFRAVLVCPACNAKMDVDFDADEVPIERRPQMTSTYTLDLGSEEKRCRTVRFRLPTGGDQEAVLGMDMESAVDALLGRCLIDNGGTPLSPTERNTVIDAMEQLAPEINLELELVCPECGLAFVEPFDITTFFFKEMRVNAGMLLREVHHLAFYYHWNESDILSLTRERRRAYLALLSDALRQD
jgi:uncharacterized protein YbaR (Trm112 family)